MKIFKKLTMALVAVSLVATASVAYAAPKQKVSGKVVVNGSSALLPLTLQAAKEFKKKYPKVSIPASSTSSINGPQSVKKGIAQIGACDWDASKDAPDFPAFEGLDAHPVAVIPFAVIVNKNVKVDNLSKDDLVKIFTGKITNWKEVGGEDADIVVVNRNFGSGTRVNFQAKALGGVKTVKKDKNYVEAGNSGTMHTTVGNTPNAIGYVDFAYLKSNPNIKAISYNSVAPTIDNVLNGTYPIWGIGYYMTKGTLSAATKAFIDYVQSKGFQEGYLKKLKFIPITAIKDLKK